MRHIKLTFFFVALHLMAYGQEEETLSVITTTTTSTETVEAKEYTNLGEEFSRWSLGLHAGLSQNGTDTHSWGRHAESIFNQSHLAYGLQAKYAINHNFALRADYIGSTISGDDRETDGPCSDEQDLDTEIGCHRERAWQFTSPIHELSLNFEWDILGKRRKQVREFYDKEGNKLDRSTVNLAYATYYDEDGDVINFGEQKKYKKSLSPYIAVGAALTYVNPDVFYPDNDEFPDLADIAADEAEQKNIYAHFPISAGLRWNISEKLFIDGELRGVYQRTDLLDGIKNTTQFEDFRNNDDAYQFALVRLGYRMGINEDRDGDGVADNKDVCPDIYGVIALDGCPDRDNDGISDSTDACPDVKGLRLFAGCPDSDNDGVQDLLDLCPDQKGTVETKGCPDSDNDGIVDENDVCPNYAGPKELDGCPDYDGDLVPDHRDACPEVPGEEAYHGCKEGYPSLDPENREKYKIVVPEKQVYKDANEKIVRKTTTTTTTTQAPSTQQSSSTIRRSTTTTSSTSNGQRSTSSVSTGTRTSSSSSSSVSSEVRGVFDEALTGIKFNSSKATLKKSSYATLNKVVRILSINKDLNVSINGHTDSTGDPVKNKSLSLARANSVKKFLMSRGIAENRLKTIGHGIEKPIADNSTPQGRELNRRVEFVVIN